MSKVYEIEQVVNTYEVTPESRLNPVVPLNYFQEAAQRQLESLDVGLDFMIENNLAWILVKYEITYHKYPKAEEEVIVETEPLGLNRFEASRRFVIKSLDGEELVSGKSIWVLADTVSERLKRINQVESLSDFFEGTRDINYKIPRLERVEDFDNELTFMVRYLDIDINHHVNNSKYLAWAFEALPPELLEKNEVHKVTIIYKEQSFYGDEVIVKAKEISPLKWRINIENGDKKILSELKIELRERIETD